MNPESTSTGDHVLNVIKAGLNAVPVGGALASLVSDYVPTERERRRRRLFAELQSCLVEFGDRLANEVVWKDEVMDLLEASVRVAEATGQEKKLHAMAAIVANALLLEGDHEKLAYTELDHFAKAVERLSTGAVELLCVVIKATNGRAGSTRPTKARSTSMGRLYREQPGVDPELIMGLAAELAAFNFLDLGNRPTVSQDFDANREILVTGIGLRFALKFLASKSDPL